MAVYAAEKTVIVIGAGVGGVSTAARLAQAGFKVTVLEKNDFAGGRCSLLHYKGFRFDQGPSILLFPQVVRQTFEDLGTTLEDEGIKLKKCEPNYKVWLHDATVTLSSDLAIMKSEIERWEGKEGYSRYLAFLQDAHWHYELMVEHVLNKNFSSLLSMFQWSFLKHLPTLHPFQTMWNRVGKYFWTEHLRRVFTFATMYLGISPFDAPGTYTLLQYAELAGGIWYPVGGFYSIVEALITIGKRSGVAYRLSTEAAKILISDQSHAVGVMLASGEVLTADVVINNTDLVYAYQYLLPAYKKSLDQRPTSCSSISFYWALSRKVTELEVHNIFLADEYKRSFDSVFKDHLLPEEPSFYVNVPSRIDASAAPYATDCVAVLIPVGHLVDPPPACQSQLGRGHGTASGGIVPNGADWSSVVTHARELVISTIKRRTGVDITPFIIGELVNDPITWKSRFNLDRGAILGLAHGYLNMLSFRPSTRARRPGFLDGRGGSILGPVLQLLEDSIRGRKYRDIKGLYMVGASVHPGTGVPICLGCARLVTEQVLQDLEIGAHQKSKTAPNLNQSVDWTNIRLYRDLWQIWGRVAFVMLVIGSFGCMTCVFALK